MQIVHRCLFGTLVHHRAEVLLDKGALVEQSFK
jgi:hypothetical protein